jgi:DMSO reductase anchor subunit
MNPAFSVVFLTTLIGAGQGLFVALYLSELVSLNSGGASPAGSSYFAAGSAISLLFLVAGLVASFFHLGHPERAWRAIAMWRTSWLSRECIALPVFMGAVFAYGALHYFLGSGAPTLVVGALGLVCCAALFYCTAMIYACIRFLQEWASPLTIVNFVLLGLASGFTLASAYAAVAAPGHATLFILLALLLGALGLASRLLSLRRNARLKPKSTIQSATGLHHPKVTQKAQGAMGGTFNTRHYFHGKSPALLKMVKSLFLCFAFALPLAMLAVGLAWDMALLLVLAFVVQYIGLVAERWYFFAQANHPQNLYYQHIS